MTDGFLLIDKEAGITSNDVLTRLKSILIRNRKASKPGHGESFDKLRTGSVEPSPPKIGHTGTLDPFATGLLVVAIGEAAKFISYLNEEPKVYEATLKLGEKTDTADLTGVVIELQPAPLLNAEAIRGALRNLVGDIDQVPPMYSAKKKEGRRLYELAREGIRVERKPVKIKIYELIPSPSMGDAVVSLSNQGQGEGGLQSFISFRVSCSRGTYVRSLGETIAENLGTVGYLVSLRRLRAGSFDVKDAVAVDGAWDLEKVLVPIKKALSHLPSTELTPEEEAKIIKGQPIPRSLSGTGEAPVSLLRNGHLIGIGEVRADQLCPKRLVSAKVD